MVRKVRRGYAKKYINVPSPLTVSSDYTKLCAFCKIAWIEYVDVTFKTADDSAPYLNQMQQLSVGGYTVTDVPIRKGSQKVKQKFRLMYPANKLLDILGEIPADRYSIVGGGVTNMMVTLNQEDADTQAWFYRRSLVHKNGLSFTSSCPIPKWPPVATSNSPICGRVKFP